MLKYCLPFLFSFAGLAQYSATSGDFPLLPNKPNLFAGSAGFSFDPSRAQEIELAIQYRTSFGFQVGVLAHGGLTAKEPFGSAGIDLGVGYFIEPAESFIGGLIAQLGLTYTGIGDASVNPEYAVALPLKFSAVFGRKFCNDNMLFIVPALELGHTMRGGDAVWKSGIGFQLGVGVNIPLTDDLLFASEIRPTLAEGEFLLKSSLRLSVIF